MVVFGKRQEMGLTRWTDVSIAEASERASQARRTLRDGIDPIEDQAKQSDKSNYHCPSPTDKPVLDATMSSAICGPESHLKWLAISKITISQLQIGFDDIKSI